jgi:two-component system sensor histidine kinase/response regulator
MKPQMGLTLRIALIFVLFATILLAGLGGLSFSSGRASLQAAAISELLSSAIEKESQLDKWVDERVTNLEILAKSPYLMNDMSIIANADTQPAAREQARDTAIKLLKTRTDKPARNHLLIAIVNASSGQIMLATNPAYVGKSVAGEPYFELAKDATNIQSPQISTLLGLPAMIIATPLHSEAGTPLAVLVEWISLAPLNEMLLKRSGLHYSDDAYLLNPQKEFVTRPRFKSQALILHDKPESLAASRCIAGNSGVMLTTDYRGIPAIVVYRWLPKHKLGLITKIDQTEAFTPAREFGWEIALIIGSILLGTLLVAIALARKLTQPLLALQAGVTRFGRGDLAVRLPITGVDELGQLAKDFNKMAEAIAQKEAQLLANAALLEERVKARTFELQQQADLLELAHDAIVVRDIDGTIRYWNHGAAEIYGWTSQEALLQPIHTLLQTESSTPIEVMQNALFEHSRWEGELSHSRRNGDRIAVLSRQALQRNEHGQPIAVLEINSDVTEQKTAQEELNSFFSLSLDLLAIASAEGYFTRLNPAWTRTLGYSQAELVSKPFVDFVHPDDRESTYLAAQKLAEGEEIVAFENRYRCKDGSYRWLSWQAVPAKEQIYAAAHDITDRKRTEEHLQQAKAAAEAATRSKSEFLANMSHEIRTPMNGVIGLTNLVLKTSLSRQQHEYLTLIKSSANSLLRLLNDILDFSKMEAQKLQLEIIEFDLPELIGDSLKALSALANEKKLELTYQVAADVPSHILGDPGRLAQIIVNLAGNALKFTKVGEVVVRVNYESQEGNDIVLVFSVSDTGIGVSKEHQASIFNAFAQADSSTTRQFGGTGLGLAIVSQLVSLMGGSLWLESEPGKGSTFYFKIRVAAVQNSVTTVLPPKLKSLTNMRVLVADDNRTNLLILEDLLNGWGMRTVSFESAQAALAELRHSVAIGDPIPLALLDSQMPHFDGFQLVEAINSDEALTATTMMMLSSSDLPGEVARCKTLNIARYLTKPIKQSELFNEIVTAMSGLSGETATIFHAAPDSLAKPTRLLNILVAEDHPINQALLSEILRARGHAFTMANNGLEVLQLLETQPFDVILMDGQMPELDGYQTTIEIRKREKQTGKRIRIIAVTANAMKEDRDICLAAGMDDYISKPIDEAQLLEKLETKEEAIAVSASPANAEQLDSETAINTFDVDTALKRALGKPMLLKQLIGAFLQDLPKSVIEVGAAVEAKSAERLIKSTHRLRGAAVTLSADALVEVLSQLELCGKNNTMDVTTAMVKIFQQRAVALETELNKFLSEAL